MAAKIAPLPQKALPRVNQSASWKSRIIEKWRFIGASVGFAAACQTECDARNSGFTFPSGGRQFFDT
ncbi:hypothetical protein PAGU2638_16210 [Lysobacter sp. PAGU 2638]